MLYGGKGKVGGEDMILYDGKYWESSFQDEILKELESKINETRRKPRLALELVLNAAEKCKEDFVMGKMDFLKEELTKKDLQAIQQLFPLLDKENLRKRVELELGEMTQPDSNYELRRVPLGTLFHIAAGNQDGLPAYSVLEGLMSGNINILKLPSVDHSLSISILYHLIEIEPKLKDYIIVFDTPSSDSQAIFKMAEMADGLVIWGSDQSIAAIRKQAPLNAKLIEWGHRISFVYIDDFQNKEKEMIELAEHVAWTRQRLCSSCQVIYLNSDSLLEAEKLIEEFLPILDKAFLKDGLSMNEQGEMMLRRYTDHLCQVMEKENNQGKIYWGKACSILLKEDKTLEGSGIHNQILVKCLPEKEIVTCLREKKGILQTVGLICAQENHERLVNLFVQSGINRIMQVSHMSSVNVFDSHDGEFPLSRYSRIVKIEKFKNE